MTGTLILDPLVPLALLAVVAAIALAGTLIAVVRGLNGWALRGLAALVVLGALAGPSYQQEDRAPLSDIVLMVEDQSASQRLGDRATQSTEAANALAASITARPNTELRRVTVPDGVGDAGTELMRALTAALAEEPRGRVAGVIALSDGRVHDADLPVNLPAPMHLLMSGLESDWDRRLTVRNAPAFAIIGEPVTLTLRIDDLGAAPADQQLAELDISVDGEDPQTFRVPIGEDLELPITLPHGGRNVIRFSLPQADGELTDRNNSALIQMNGVRDRLRVLLVSCEPHAGAGDAGQTCPGSRCWRPKRRKQPRMVSTSRGCFMAMGKGSRLRSFGEPSTFAQHTAARKVPPPCARSWPSDAPESARTSSARRSKTQAFESMSKLPREPRPHWPRTTSTHDWSMSQGLHPSRSMF